MSGPLSVANPHVSDAFGGVPSAEAAGPIQLCSTVIAPPSPENTWIPSRCWSASTNARSWMQHWLTVEPPATTWMPSPDPDTSHRRATSRLSEEMAFTCTSPGVAAGTRRTVTSSTVNTPLPAPFRVIPNVDPGPHSTTPLRSVGLAPYETTSALIRNRSSTKSAALIRNVPESHTAPDGNGSPGL